jgi:hypothetical protein
MSPPSAWIAGRIAWIVCSTFSRTMAPAQGFGTTIVAASKGRNNLSGSRVPKRPLSWLAPGSRAWDRRAVVIAHQGGWDELLLVALPVGLFAVLLFVANRKAQSQLEAEETVVDVDDEASDKQ